MVQNVSGLLKSTQLVDETNQNFVESYSNHWNGGANISATVCWLDGTASVEFNVRRWLLIVVPRRCS